MASTSMERFQKGLAVRREAFKAIGSKVAASLGLGGVVLYTVLKVVAEYFKDSFVGRIAEGILGFLGYLFLMPMGSGIALLVFVVSVTILYVAWDARQKPQHVVLPEPAKPTPPPIISEAEYRAIDEVRVFCRGPYKKALDQASIVSFALRDHRPRNSRVTWLLSYPQGEVDMARHHMLNALADSSSKPLAEVRSHFDNLAEKYMVLLRWIHTCEEFDPELLQKAPYVQEYEKWRRWHDEMVSELRALTLKANLSQLAWALNNLIEGKERFE